MKRIIIIGGMGPQASLELHRRIIAKASENGARNGNDFPHIVHFSLPVEDFISDRSKTAEALEFMLQELKDFRFRKSDMIVMACNTAHLLQKDLEQRLGITILSLVDLTVAHIANSHANVQLLASPTTIQTGLYTDKLKKAGVTVSLPTHEQIPLIEKTIRAVIANQPFQKLKSAEKTSVLGCTELSCAFGDTPNVIDPLSLLVDKLLSKEGVV